MGLSESFENNVGSSSGLAGNPHWSIEGLDVSGFTLQRSRQNFFSDHTELTLTSGSALGLGASFE